MKTLNITSRSFFTALAVATLALGAGTFAATGVASADACSSKCDKDWPRSIMHAVQRNACKAKCAAISMSSSAAKSVSAAWERTKSVAGAVVDKTKEVAKKVVDTGKKVVKTVVDTGKKVAKTVVDTGKKVVNKVVEVAKKLIPRGIWDAVKKCIADGFGGCAKKIITAAGNLARGLWDKVKNSVADGLGGCLRKIATAAAELACKGVGIVFDKAKQCCAKKGAVQCLKDGAKYLIRKGAQWLCDKFAGTVVPKLNQGAAWLINKVGSALASYKLSLRGSEIGSLACAFKSALGHTITDISKKFGDPYLTISNIKIGAAPQSNTINAHLGATATISVPGKEGALSLQLLGEVDAAIDTSCNFQKALATFGARIKEVKISNIPQWLTNAAVANFVNPNLGCKTICMKPIKAAGMNVNLDYCRVIDNCLRSNCTAPVLNTVLNQLFPIGVSVGSLVAGKKIPAAVKNEVSSWYASVGGVRFHAGSKDPYRPSISATVSIGPKGAPKFNINATGSLGIKTYCTKNESMVKITPSVAIRLGNIEQLKWLQDAPKNIGNSMINDFVNSKGGQAGRFVVNYPSILSGKAAEKHSEKTLDAAASGPSLMEKIKSNWEGLKMAVQTALAGRFRGNAKACAAVEKPAAAGGGGGACSLCMKVPAGLEANVGRAVDANAPAPDAQLGHVAAEAVNFRKGPGTNHASMAVLKRCTEFKVLQKHVKGNVNFWNKVEYKGKVGYVAESYVGRGKAHCGTVARR